MDSAEELENHLQAMGYSLELSKKAAAVCAEIVDVQHRVDAALNFIEAEMQEPHETTSQPERSARSRGMKMTVCVRNDISMSSGKVASQVAHACLQLATSSILEQQAIVREWQRSSNEKIVVLQCDSLDGINAIENKAKEIGIPAATISDAGRTEVESGTITCIAVGPAYEDDIDNITGSLRLL